MNPCTQEKRALERKLSEMEEEMKVGNNLLPLSVWFLCFVLMSFGIVTQEQDIQGVHGRGPLLPLSMFLCADRIYFNGQVLRTLITDRTVSLSFI